MIGSHGVLRDSNGSISTLFSQLLGDFDSNGAALKRILWSFPWQHDLFEDSLRAARISGVENKETRGGKELVTMTDVDESIQEIFQAPHVQRNQVHVNKALKLQKFTIKRKRQ
ncbi:hypothetical protein V6N11_055275 [Hibiscus sabdariffa]|uniref:Uncharacterized protein n=1 Tax=Hibiscus sabdariffa TaxID=183260 RepID=A0ABR2PF96_9ROSI